MAQAPVRDTSRSTGDRCTGPRDRGTAASPRSPSPSPSPSPREEAPTAPAQTSAPRDPRVLILPQDAYLAKAAADLAEQLFYRSRRGDIVGYDDEQAGLAFSILRRVEPALTVKSMSKLIYELELHRPETLDELYRLSRYAGLGKLLVDLGINFERMSSHWSFDGSDALQFLVGVNAGVAYELGVGLIVAAVASLVLAGAVALLTPELAIILSYLAYRALSWEIVKAAFGEANVILHKVGRLLSSPLVSGERWLDKLSGKMLAEMMRGNFYEAGYNFGQLTAQLIFAFWGIRDLALLAPKVAVRLRPLTKAVAVKVDLVGLLFQLERGEFAEVVGGSALRGDGRSLIVRIAGEGPYKADPEALMAFAREQEAAAAEAARGTGEAAKAVAARPAVPKAEFRPGDAEGWAPTGRAIETRPVKPSPSQPAPELGPPPAGAIEVKVSQAEYLMRLEQIFPKALLNVFDELTDEIGYQAAELAARDPAFEVLLQRAQTATGKIRSDALRDAGNIFHRAANRIAKTMQLNDRLPQGWLMRAEFVPTGASDVRLDLLFEGPQKQLIVRDWKTGIRSAYSWKVDRQMTEYVAKLTDGYGATVQSIQSRTWMDYARGAMPGFFSQ